MEDDCRRRLGSKSREPNRNSVLQSTGESETIYVPDLFSAGSRIPRPRSTCAPQSRWVFPPRGQPGRRPSQVYRRLCRLLQLLVIGKPAKGSRPPNRSQRSWRKPSPTSPNRRQRPRSRLDQRRIELAFQRPAWGPRRILSAAPRRLPATSLLW